MNDNDPKEAGCLQDRGCRNCAVADGCVVRAAVLAFLSGAFHPSGSSASGAPSCRTWPG